MMVACSTAIDVIKSKSRILVKAEENYILLLISTWRIVFQNILYCTTITLLTPSSICLKTLFICCIIKGKHLPQLHVVCLLTLSILTTSYFSIPCLLVIKCNDNHIHKRYVTARNILISMNYLSYLKNNKMLNMPCTAYYLTTIFSRWLILAKCVYVVKEDHYRRTGQCRFLDSDLEILARWSVSPHLSTILVNLQDRNVQNTRNKLW